MYQIQIEAQTGSEGYIAVDDFRLTNGPCKGKVNHISNHKKKNCIADEVKRFCIKYALFSIDIQTSAWKVECLLDATLRQTAVNGQISVLGSLFGNGIRMVQPPPTLAHQWTTLLAQNWVKKLSRTILK